MPRSPRSDVHAPGVVLHVISRFVGEEFLLATDALRRRFMSRAVSKIAGTDWILLAYALMSSHVHWLFLTGHASLADIFHPLNTWFAGFANEKRGSFGPVFAGRPRCIPIEGDSCALVIAYLHNNPVRAGVVRHACESSWTSHQAYVGRVRPPPWLNTQLGLQLSGFESNPAGRSAFEGFVRRCEREPRQVRFSGPPIQPADLSELMDMVIEQVSLRVGVERQALCMGSRKRRAVQGRRLALTAWTRCLGLPASELARGLGLSGASASYLLRGGTARSLDREAMAIAQVVAAGAQ